jgi:uncharacterized protein YebE (UPF0316 family)
MITDSQILTAVIIFGARIVDVSLSTFRHVMIIKRKRLYAFSIAFFESLIWVYAVSRVITNLTDPITAIAFALGFASGTFVGITIEGFIKIGDQAVRVFSSKGDSVAKVLREMGFRITVFDGHGRDGVVKMLFVQTRRRDVKKVFKKAREIDPACFMVVDDISQAFRA